MAEEVAGPKQGTYFCYFAEQVSEQFKYLFLCPWINSAAFSPGQRGFFCNGES